MTILGDKILTNAKRIHMAFHELKVNTLHESYHDGIHCINEFISMHIWCILQSSNGNFYSKSLY